MSYGNEPALRLLRLDEDTVLEYFIVSLLC